MNRMKRTKIVATLGPSTSSAGMIEKLIKAGVNTFRLNFSHGTHETHEQLIGWIKDVRKKLKAPVAILQDLGGPKIRLGNITDPPLVLKQGDELVLHAGLEKNSGNIIPVTYSGFANDVKAGHRLLLADGSLEVKIMRIEPPRVFCKVLVGGELSSHKGINYPQGSFSLPAITGKDKVDLKFGLDQGVDYVALSFVKAAGDIAEAREICRAHRNSTVPLIAKIEKHEAIRNFYEILNSVDGIMVARGDLGVEIPLEKVPLAQKKIIRLANLHGKPVITATQMLLSMVNAHRPTRAEATDITNAIFDGTDAIMLSEETASGQYPLEAVETMSRIALETENNFPYYSGQFRPGGDISEMDIARAISQSATSLAQHLEAPVILCPTSSGFTARMISRFRPGALIFALTSNEATYYRSSLLWGVNPCLLAMEEQLDALLEKALNMVQKKVRLKKKDRYVVTAGYPFGRGGPTNLIYAGEVE